MNNMQCALCSNSFPTGTNCGFCKNKYCFVCSKITEVDYGNLKPYLRAAWKCPSCAGENAPISSSLAMSGPADNALQEVMRQLKEMSSKLECIPKLISDVESLKAEILELKNARPSEARRESKHESARTARHHKEKRPSQTLKEPTPPPEDKSPFASAPESSFDLAEFKKVYSKEDLYTSISYFWRNFDGANWSIWHAEYKYPEELTKVFMSCNVITGMFQKLDKMRHHAFVSMCVFGEDNNSSISGVWVWRGHQLIFPLAEEWKEDYECYEWRKLDLGAEETSRLLQNYFSWSGLDGRGRKFNTGKIFK